MFSIHVYYFSTQFNKKRNKKCKKQNNSICLHVVDFFSSTGRVVIFVVLESVEAFKAWLGAQSHPTSCTFGGCT